MLQPDKPPDWKSWGALLRLSLMPSALADPAAGLLLGGGAALEPRILGAFAASLLIYHGGMALNDWRDRHADRATRPDRPLVSGALPPGQALGFAVLALAAGPLFGLISGPLPALLWAAVALAVLVYDLAPFARRTSPLWLGLCRAGNLLAAGTYAAGLSTPPGDLAGLALPLGAVALAYGAYVAAVSWLARLEDDPLQAPGGRPRGRLILAAGLLISSAPAGALLGPTPRLNLSAALAGGLVLAAWAACGLLLRAARQAQWTQAEVARDVGAALRRLLVFTAAASLASARPGALWVALGILCGYPLARGLRRVFPPS